MKNKVFKKIGILLGILVFWIAGTVIANAASFGASISSTSVDIGDTFTVTVSADNAAGNYEITTSNANATLVSGDASEFLDNQSGSATYKAVSAGTVTITATATDMTDLDDSSKAVTGSKSFTVTINAPADPDPVDPGTPEEEDEERKENTPVEGEEKEVKEESRNNYLSSLTVSVGTLTPSFNRETQDYTLEFPKDFDFKTLTSIVVTSTLEDEKASKEGDGTFEVKEGENTISIRVTAEQGNYRTYVIKFTKDATVKASDLKLSALVINIKDALGKMMPADLSPAFKADVFEYSLKVGKDVESLSITPTIDLEDVEVKVEGGKNLIPGKNVVTITLTSKKDSKIVSKYVINVEKEKEEVVATTGEENKGGWSIKEWLLLIAGIAFVALVVVLVVLFVIMRKNKIADEDEFSEGEEDETKIEAEISEHIKNFDKPEEKDEEVKVDEEKEEVEPKVEFVEEEKEEPKQEIDFSKEPEELPEEKVEELKEEKKELPLIETTLDDIRETERKLDEEDPRGRYRGKRFE